MTTPTTTRPALQRVGLGAAAQRRTDTLSGCERLTVAVDGHAPAQLRELLK